MISIALEVYKSLNKIQQEILYILAMSGEQMSGKEIKSSFSTEKNRGRFANAMLVLVGKGLVATEEKHGILLYKAVAPNEESVTIMLPSVTKVLPNSPEISHDTYMNHDHDSHEINKQIKGKISKKKKTQASVSAPSESAGSAVEAPTPALASTAPAEPRKKKIFNAAVDPTNRGYLARMENELADSTISCGELDIPLAKQEAFENAVKAAGERLAKHKQKNVYDSVTHMLAFATAMELTGFYGRKDESGRYVSGIEWMERKIDEWAETVRKTPISKPVAMYVLILQELEPLYIDAGFGWNFPIENGRLVQSCLVKSSAAADIEWERVKNTPGAEFRWHLFPAYQAYLRNKKEEPEKLPLYNQIDVVEAKLQAERTAEKENTSAERPHAVLSKLQESLGDNRYDLRFGNDSRCEIKNGKAVFWVRNQFAANEIRRLHSSEIAQAIAACGLPPPPADDPLRDVEFRINPPSAQGLTTLGKAIGGVCRLAGV